MAVQIEEWKNRDEIVPNAKTQRGCLYERKGNVQITVRGRTMIQCSGYTRVQLGGELFKCCLASDDDRKSTSRRAFFVSSMAQR